VQGGILAGMIDNCVGPALAVLVPERTAALIQLSVNYLGPVEPGISIIGRAQVVRRGRTQAVIDATLERESDGKLLVKAVATNVFTGDVEDPIDVEKLTRSL